jgi:hypothetical protein
MSDSIERLSFRLTSDELAEQERAVATLRTCAGTVMAAASVAGSFFGASVRDGSLNALGMLAMTSYVLCSASAIWVLLPHSFVFAFRGDTLLGFRRSGTVREVDEAFRAAGAWIAPQVGANRQRLATLAECLTASCVLLAVEVALWTASLFV